jgi:hypothetical protein
MLQMMPRSSMLGIMESCWIKHGMRFLRIQLWSDIPPATVEKGFLYREVN